MQDYSLLIETKYPGAVTGVNFEVTWQPDPDLMQPGTFDEEGRFIPPDNSNVPLIPILTRWELPDPAPTFAELDAYGVSPEFLAAWGAKLKAEAEAEVNKWANQK